VRAAALALGIAVALAIVPAAAMGARVVASDTGTDSPLSFWKAIDCQEESRQQILSGGADPHPTATGAPQGDDSFRRLTVLDGDDFFGERCELGENARPARNTFYRPGKRRITKLSVRLPSNFPLGLDTWQAVMQMKQTGPADNSGGTPVLELDAYGGRWRLRQSLSTRSAEDSRELWSRPAAHGVWTRFSFDIRYSASNRKGYIRIKVDLNGDLDYKDTGERSKRIRTYTLKVETRGSGGDGLGAGNTIPSHLRAGIYHDSDYECPPPDGCSVDLDNVQVVRP
jgi:Polysaccharide lyase